MSKEEILAELYYEPFYIYSNKGNILSVEHINNKWYLQGQEVKNPRILEKIEKEFEKNKKDINKTYDQLLDTLSSSEVWDSGNLSNIEYKILDKLFKEGKVTKEKGVEGIHDTYSGAAKWIYSLKEELENRETRMQNLHHSLGAKKGWLRHRNNYMRANRKKSREAMNKTFYGLAKELAEVLDINESKINKDKIFDLECDILFDNISGGLSFNINKEDGNISFSVLLDESGNGNYKLENESNNEDELKALYNDLKDEMQQLAQTLDDGIKQILARHGLRET